MTPSTRILPHPDPEDISLTSVLFALSDPARLALVRQVERDGARTVAMCRQAEPDVPKSTFSHHLGVLRESGVIRNDPNGRQRTITVRRDDLDRRFPGLLDAVLG